MSYALVTGAAKGIGKAIATELAKRNYNLILVDLDDQALVQVAGYLSGKYGVDVQYIHTDLSKDGAVENITARHHVLGAIQIIGAKQIAIVVEQTVFAAVDH